MDLFTVIVNVDDCIVKEWEIWRFIGSTVIYPERKYFHSINETPTLSKTFKFDNDVH